MRYINHFRFIISNIINSVSNISRDITLNPVKNNNWFRFFVSYSSKFSDFFIPIFKFVFFLQFFFFTIVYVCLVVVENFNNFLINFIKFSNDNVSTISSPASSYYDGSYFEISFVFFMVICVFSFFASWSIFNFFVNNTRFFKAYFTCGFFSLNLTNVISVYYYSYVDWYLFYTLFLAYIILGIFFKFVSFRYFFIFFFFVLIFSFIYVNMEWFLSYSSNLWYHYKNYVSEYQDYNSIFLTIFNNEGISSIRANSRYFEALNYNKNSAKWPFYFDVTIDDISSPIFEFFIRTFSTINFIFNFNSIEYFVFYFTNFIVFLTVFIFFYSFNFFFLEKNPVYFSFYVFRIILFGIVFFKFVLVSYFIFSTYNYFSISFFQRILSYYLYWHEVFMIFNEHIYIHNVFGVDVKINFINSYSELIFQVFTYCVFWKVFWYLFFKIDPVFSTYTINFDPDYGWFPRYFMYYTFDTVFRISNYVRYKFGTLTGKDPINIFKERWYTYKVNNFIIRLFRKLKVEKDFSTIYKDYHFDPKTGKVLGLIDKNDRKIDLALAYYEVQKYFSKQPYYVWYDWKEYFFYKSYERFYVDIMVSSYRFMSSPYTIRFRHKNSSMRLRKKIRKFIARSPSPGLGMSLQDCIKFNYLEYVMRADVEGLDTYEKMNEYLVNQVDIKTFDKYYPVGSRMDGFFPSYHGRGVFSNYEKFIYDSMSTFKYDYENEKRKKGKSFWFGIDSLGYSNVGNPIKGFGKYADDLRLQYLFKTDYYDNYTNYIEELSDRFFDYSDFIEISNNNNDDTNSGTTKDSDSGFKFFDLVLYNYISDKALTFFYYDETDFASDITNSIFFSSKEQKDFFFCLFCIIFDVINYFFEDQKHVFDLPYNRTDYVISTFSNLIKKYYVNKTFSKKGIPFLVMFRNLSDFIFNYIVFDFVKFELLKTNNFNFFEIEIKDKYVFNLMNSFDSFIQRVFNKYDFNEFDIFESFFSTFNYYNIFINNGYSYFIGSGIFESVLNNVFNSIPNYSYLSVWTSFPEDFDFFPDYRTKINYEPGTHKYFFSDFYLNFFVSDYDYLFFKQNGTVFDFGSDLNFGRIGRYRVLDIGLKNNKVDNSSNSNGEVGKNYFDKTNDVIDKFYINDNFENFYNFDPVISSSIDSKKSRFIDKKSCVYYSNIISNDTKTVITDNNKIIEPYCYSDMYYKNLPYISRNEDDILINNFGLNFGSINSFISAFGEWTDQGYSESKINDFNVNFKNLNFYSFSNTSSTVQNIIWGCFSDFSEVSFFMDNVNQGLNYGLVDYFFSKYNSKRFLVYNSILNNKLFRFYSGDEYAYKIDFLNTFISSPNFIDRSTKKDKDLFDIIKKEKKNSKIYKPINIKGKVRRYGLSYGKLPFTAFSYSFSCNSDINTSSYLSFSWDFSTYGSDFPIQLLFNSNSYVYSSTFIFNSYFSQRYTELYSYMFLIAGKENFYGNDIFNVSSKSTNQLDFFHSVFNSMNFYYFYNNCFNYNYFNYNSIPDFIVSDFSNNFFVVNNFKIYNSHSFFTSLNNFCSFCVEKENEICISNEKIINKIDNNNKIIIFNDFSDNQQANDKIIDFSDSIFYKYIFDSKRYFPRIPSFYAKDPEHPSVYYYSQKVQSRYFRSFVDRVDLDFNLISSMCFEEDNISKMNELVCFSSNYIFSDKNTITNYIINESEKE